MVHITYVAMYISIANYSYNLWSIMSGQPPKPNFENIRIVYLNSSFNCSHVAKLMHAKYEQHNICHVSLL